MMALSPPLLPHTVSAVKTAGLHGVGGVEWLLWHECMAACVRGNAVAFALYVLYWGSHKCTNAINIELHPENVRSQGEYHRRSGKVQCITLFNPPRSPENQPVKSTI